jgi:hypothetical protein
MQQVRLARDRHWRGYTFPRQTTWMAHVYDDGRLALQWHGNRVPLRDEDVEGLGRDLGDQVERLADG